LIPDTIKYINYRLDPGTREGVVYGTQSRKIICILWYKSIDGPNKGQVFHQRKDKTMNEKIVAAISAVKVHKTKVIVVLTLAAITAASFVAKSVLDKRASQEVQA